MLDAKLKLAYVVDDDEVIKYLTEKMFRQLDFCEKLEFFQNPLDAFEKLKHAGENGHELPDLILLDLRMPEMDGWSFLEGIEDMAVKNKIPVFVFSSSINEDDKLRSQQYSSVKDYIIKPLTVQKINKILREVR